MLSCSRRVYLSSGRERRPHPGPTLAARLASTRMAGASKFWEMGHEHGSDNQLDGIETRRSPHQSPERRGVEVMARKVRIGEQGGAGSSVSASSHRV